jgi:hypothetical protein
MPTFSSALIVSQKRASERGAALLTVLLISTLLLAAGGALIMTTALSATNAVDSTAETQAYYAAEAGMQAALNVLRGNVAPNPLFNTSSASADENKITFRKAVTTPDLSRWLTYSTSYATPRVTISDNYTAYSGMAYSVSATDPDNTGTVIFSVAGVFPTSANTDTKTFTVGSGNGNKAIITYSPPTTNPTTINSTGSASFGSFQVTPDKAAQFGSFDINANYPQGISFNLTITQTSPYTVTVVIPCKLTGTISSAASNNSVQLSIIPPTTSPTLTSNDIGGAMYSRTTNTFPLTYNATTNVSPVTVTAPEPRRLLVKVTGYGPHASEKHLQMMVSRFAFEYTSSAAITLRGADDTPTTAMTFSIGDSAKYQYSGNDNAGGAGLPAIAVTNLTDYTKASTATLGNTQVTGTSQVQQVSISSLPSLLQTAQGARDVVSYFRELSKTVHFSFTCNTQPDDDRYFASGETPCNYGADQPNGLLTFVDGDATLPPAGGAGLLVVTGTLDMRGAADFKGLVLVLGGGKVLRNGGGNGTTLGTMFVAKFGATGDFQAPYFDSNGTGTANLYYDSKWVEKALMTAGPRVWGMSEY